MNKYEIEQALLNHRILQDNNHRDYSFEDHLQKQISQLRKMLAAAIKQSGEPLYVTDHEMREDSEIEINYDEYSRKFVIDIIENL